MGIEPGSSVSLSAFFLVPNVQVAGQSGLAVISDFKGGHRVRILKERFRRQKERDA
jgi:hypothetical protein